MWEINSDLLEKNVPLILMLLWPCATHNVVPSHDLFLMINDYWLGYTINTGMLTSQSCAVKGSKV